MFLHMNGKSKFFKHFRDLGRSEFYQNYELAGALACKNRHWKEISRRSNKLPYSQFVFRYSRANHTERPQLPLLYRTSIVLCVFRKLMRGNVNLEASNFLKWRVPLPSHAASSILHLKFLWRTYGPSTSWHMEVVPTKIIKFVPLLAWFHLCFAAIMSFVLIPSRFWSNEVFINFSALLTS